jgi:hypothetical protein
MTRTPTGSGRAADGRPPEVTPSARPGKPAARPAAPTPAAKKTLMRPGGGPRLMIDPGDRANGRDGELLRWVGRHGVVTQDQIIRRWFTSRNVGLRRIYTLRKLGLLWTSNWFWRESPAVRLSPAGADVARTTDPDGQYDLGIVRNIVWAEIRHTIALVDLTEQLLALHPGATLTTEREIRAQHRRELRAGTRKTGQAGRAPDGVLHLPDGTDVALELDRTPKRKKDYARLIADYKGESYKKIWWYVTRPEPKELRRPDAVDAVAKTRAEDLRRLVAADRWAANRIEVGIW